MDYDSERIFLLADDDTDDLDMFYEALTEIDPSIILYRASDGNEALEKLKSGELKQPRIIFLDTNMPGMNGYECLVELKAYEQFRNIPVIVYSTSSHQKIADKAISLGAMCFFTKPNNFEELKMILKIFVDNPIGNVSGAINKFNAAMGKKIFLCI